MRRAVLLALSPLVLIAACKPANDPGATADPEAIIAEIRKAEAGQMAAFGTKDLAGVTAVYAPDASFIKPGEAVQKGEGITRSFEAMLKDPAFKLEPIAGSETQWVAASGDLAATGFNATMTSTGADGKVTSEPVANQTVWQKQADGSWKIVSDFNVVYPTEAAAAE